MDEINITSLIVRIKIGVSDEERATAQRVRVDMTLTTDFTEAIRTKNLARSVNYSHVRHGVLALARDHECVLLEELGHHILRRVFAEEKVERVSVTLQKLDAWVDGIPGITMSRRREEMKGSE